MSSVVNRRLLLAAAAFFLTGLLAGACTRPSFGSLPAEEPDGPAMLADVRRLAAVDDARMAGSPGEAAAAAWTAERLAGLGLEVSVQDFPIRAYQSGPASVAVGGRPELKVHPLTYSPATPDGGLQADLVYAGLGRPEDFRGLEAAGKLVLIERGQLWFRTKVENAAAAGAIGCLIYDPAREEWNGSLVQPAAIPAVALAGSDGRELAGKLGSGARIQVKLTSRGRVIEGRSRNVVARLPGRERGGALVLGAHIDGVDTPAALDNASGVASLLELARRFTAGGMPPRDLLFVLFGAEELGLFGSRHFVANPPEDGSSGMINLDTVGSGERFMLYAKGGGNTLTELAVAAAAGLGLAAERGEADNSDHASFADAGIPAVFLMREPEQRLHTDADNPEAVSVQALKDTVKLAESIAVAWLMRFQAADKP